MQFLAYFGFYHYVLYFWTLQNQKLVISYEEKFVCLKGLTSTTTELVDDKEICRVSKVGSKWLWLQLLSSANNSSEHITGFEVSQLLQKYSKVFDEPNG